jgi:glycosidase
VVVDHISQAIQVAVSGEFNDWQQQPMVRDGELWQASLGNLPPGVTAYRFFEDGSPETLPAQAQTAWWEDQEHRALVVGDCQQPLLFAVSGTASADGTISAVFGFTRASDGAPLQLDSLQATVGRKSAAVAYDAQTGRITVTAEGLPPGKASVRLQALDTQGRGPEHGLAFLPIWVQDQPFDWADGLIYGLFIDRFRDGGPDGLGPTPGAGPGKDWLGGDLIGAKAALDEGYFDALGVRTLLLSPVYDNPAAAHGPTDGGKYTGYHGYWPIRARAVEERWGAGDITGHQALLDFIDAAHARGIRVLFDSVTNQVHQDHEYRTEHPEWFTAEPCLCTTDIGPCNWDTNALGCWFTDYLPDLDYRQPALVEQVLLDAEWWIETFDFDGFRVDAAKHMDHVIMKGLRHRVAERYERPSGTEFFLVGETYTGAGGQGLIRNYVSPHELSGQFDFPLLYGIRGIGTGAGFNSLAGEVAGSNAVYGDVVDRMPVFLGNHDVTRYATDIAGCGDRDLSTVPFGVCPDLLLDGALEIMTQAEWRVVNAMALSLAFVITQPGPPFLYYGDEIGLAGGKDPDNRRMMPWGRRSLAQRTLYEAVAELSRVRQESAALKHGDRVELWADENLYVYSRSTLGQTAIVALHRGERRRTQTIRIPPELGLEGEEFTDALSGGHGVTVTRGAMSLSLDPWEYIVLIPKS